MKSNQELVQYFSDALGADAIIPSPDTGRPYVKVGTRGDAALYLSVAIQPICHHPAHGPDRGLCALLSARGRGPDP